MSKPHQQDVTAPSPEPQPLLHPAVAREFERLMNPTPEDFLAAYAIYRDALLSWHRDHETIQ